MAPYLWLVWCQYGARHDWRQPAGWLASQGQTKGKSLSNDSVWRQLPYGAGICRRMAPELYGARRMAPYGTRGLYVASMAPEPYLWRREPYHTGQSNMSEAGQAR